MGGVLEKLKARTARLSLQTASPWSELRELREGRKEGWEVRHQPNLSEANGEPQSREKGPCAGSPTVRSHWGSSSTGQGDCRVKMEQIRSFSSWRLPTTLLTTQRPEWHISMVSQVAERDASETVDPNLI